MRIKKYINLLRIATNSKITKVPLSVLAELRRNGQYRLPKDIDRKIVKGNSLIAVIKLLNKWVDTEFITRHNNQWVINSFLPPFPSSAFDRMFNNLLSGRKVSPVSAFLAITSDCPYNCWHCSFSNRKKGDLQTIQWEQVINGLSFLGVSVIGFTGGEPACRKDLPKLVDIANKKGINTIVYTSGAYFNEDLAKALKASGLWALCVSLDSPFAEKFDKMRGYNGAYNNAIKTIRLSKKYGFYTMTGTVATKELLRDVLLEDVYQVAQREQVDEFRIVETMPCGKLIDASDCIFLNKDEIELLQDFHKKKNRKGKLPKVCAFNQVEGPELFGCAGGIQHMFIDSTGEVCPCDFTPLSFGNINNEDVSVVWERMVKNMGLPKRECFVKKYYKLIREHFSGEFPLPLEISSKICKSIKNEPLPDYFKMVMRSKEGESE